MMGSFVKTLLIWLLVLALPAQGIAAAAMTFCGSGHHGIASAHVAMSAASEHLHRGDSLPVHGSDRGASVAAATIDAASVTEKASQATQQKCSACASCCSLGAMLSTVPVIAAFDPAPTVFTTVVPIVDAVATDGPDRPPRIVLA